MFNIQTGQIYLEVPKTGSRSMVAAAIAAYGKRYIRCHGHQPLWYMLSTLIPNGVNAKRLAQIDSVSAVSVARDPEERLVSQIMAYCAMKNVNIDKAFYECLRQSHVVFTPQYKFYGDDVEYDLPYVGVTIYPMERMDLAQRAIGHRQPDPWHKNLGGYSEDVKQAVLNHAQFMDAIALFQPDYAIHEQALMNFPAIPAEGCLE